MISSHHLSKCCRPTNVNEKKNFLQCSVNANNSRERGGGRGGLMQCNYDRTSSVWVM